MKIGKRFLIIVLELLIIASIFANYSVFAEGETTYKVEQVTNAEDINSKNLFQYILVYERDENNMFAFAATQASNSQTVISRSNYCSVSIANGVLTVLDSAHPNIVFNFTKSKASVLEEGDHPVIQSAAGINASNNRNQIKLSSGNSGGIPGIRFVDNGNGFTFEKNADNTFKISEDNCETSSNYLSYTDYYFAKGSASQAVGFKIYRIIKEYTYTSSKFLTNEEVANIEKVEVSKTVSEYVDYSDTAIAEVTLTTNGTNYEKVCDIVLILDDSTSVYESAPSDPSKTRAQIIREDASLFAQKLLEINSENRICVIKFGRDITNEADVDSIGFSNEISKIETMIGGDKTTVNYGTDYSAAFRKANEILESKSNPSHGKVVIFISDGMPSYYNGVHYEVFSETADSTGVANNWVNYVNGTPLEEAELMKKTGTTIYTIGSIEEDTSMDHSNGYIIPAGTTRSLLSNITNREANFYEFDRIETELENILDDLSKDFSYYPTNAIVTDKLTTDIELLTKNVKGYIPKIVFKRGDTAVETITFNENGTEAYSDLKPGENILNGKKINGVHFSFNGDDIIWNIGDLYKYTYTLEFPIYLNNTVNTYGEGSSRPTGDYSVSDTTQLNYTDVTNTQVTEEFESVKLNWVSPNKPTSTKTDTPVVTGTSESTGVAENTGTGTITKTKETSKLLNTGDNTPAIAVIVIIFVIALNIYQYRHSSTRLRIGRQSRGNRKWNEKPRIERIKRK